MSQSPADAQEIDGSHPYLRHFDRLGRLINQGQSFSGHEQNCIFWNMGGKRFADVAASIGFGLSDDGRALGMVDWDRDGDLDFWVNNRNSPRVRFIRNRLEEMESTSNRWIAFELKGRKLRDAIGAKVVLEFRDASGRVRTAVQTLRAGGGFLGQSSKTLHFGLGESPQLVKASIRWPDAPNQVHYLDVDRLQLDQFFRIIATNDRKSNEPPRVVQLNTEPATSIASPGQTNLSRTSNVADSSVSSRVYLSQRKPLGAPLSTQLRNVLQVSEMRRGSLGLAWATWCSSCVEELRELVELRPELEKLGVQLIAMNVDDIAVSERTQPQPVPNRASDLLRSLGWTYSAMTLDRASAASLLRAEHGVLYRERPLRLPFAVLLDDQDRVAAIYRGRLSRETLLADIRTLDKGAKSVSQRSFPFEGLSLTREFKRDPLADSLAWMEAGDTARADRQLAAILSASNSKLSPMARTRAYELRDEILAAANGPMAQTRRIDSLREAVQRLPRQLRLRTRLATTLYELGQVDEATQHLEELIRVGRRSPSILLAVGKAYELISVLNSARDCYRMAVDIEPRNVEALTNLGAVSGMLGDSKAAEDLYRAAIGIDENAYVASNNLALLLASNSDSASLSEARQLAEKVVRMDDGRSASTLDTLATVLRASGESDLSNGILKDALRRAKLSRRDDLASKIRTQLSKSTPEPE